MTRIPMPVTPKVGRERILPTLVAIAELLDEICCRLDRIERRPAIVQEWRPNHRRHVDGGEPVKAQRRKAGVR